MDILEQYEKQNPQISPESAQLDVLQGFQEESFLVRFVMRLSGGRILNMRQANYALVGIIVLSLALAFLIYNVIGPETVTPIESVTIPSVLPLLPQ